MISKIKALLTKYREQILYLIFGGLTTLVDWAVSFLLYSFEWNIHLADVIAWVAAVLFAFVTNRVWVFSSEKKGFLPILSELFFFAGGRVLTLGLQELTVFGLYDCLEWNKYLVKILAAVIVVIVNYFISKWIVFRKSKKETE